MNELEEYFVYKCYTGLEKRGLADKTEYTERLEYEIKTILGMGFPGYFLIVQDFINWAKKNDIYVGPGRGSAAGSLVSFSLGITNVDPIRFGLLFERFLNPDRISMPDIDIDFEERYRSSVINYVIEKYGLHNVAHIGTFNLMRARAAVKAVTKTLGFPYLLGENINKALLDNVAGKPQPLQESINKVEKVQGFMKNPNSSEAQVINWARKVENMPSSVGVHASGIVISNEPLIEKVPLFKSKHNEITTQWEMNNIEEAGLIKFDFLGLDALTKIHNCIDLIKERHGVSIDIDNLPLDDEKTYANLRTGDTVGVFQLESSSGIKDLLLQIRPKELEDIASLVAMYRPGPLGAKYKDTYLAVRAGVEKPKYLIPELEPILKETEGWLIYQEQCMRIAKDLCGYTGGEADSLRKAIGKKKLDLMKTHEEKMRKGWIANGLPEDAYKKLWKEMVEFAAYGFNKSHAVAYAYVTYQTAYLKAHYPIEYMCAVMISKAGNRDVIIKCIEECKRLGFSVLAPDINTSQQSFSVIDNKTIRFGLGPIKNIGAAAQVIFKERKQNGAFKDFKDFCHRVDLSIVNRTKIDSLTKSGAFDSFGYTRAAVLNNIEDVWEYRKQTKSYESKLETYYKKKEAYKQRFEDIVKGKLSDTGKKLKPLKEPPEPKKPEWPIMVNLPELTEKEIQIFEHELLGFYVTSHPLDKIMSSTLAKKFVTIEEVKQLPSGTTVFLAVVIASKQEITTKTKKQMAFVQLEDLTGGIEGVCFSTVYVKHSDLLSEIAPLRVEGRLQVSETDEGKVYKVNINDMSIIDHGIEDTVDKPLKLKVQLPLSRTRDLTKLLNKYSGDYHKIRVTLQADDGSMFTMPDISISKDHISFTKEYTRLVDERVQY